MTPLTDNEQDDYDERVAIMEIDGGLTLREAERLAIERVLRRRELKEKEGESEKV